MKDSVINDLTRQAFRRQRELESDRHAFLDIPRELKPVAYLLADGWTDREIAGFLELQLGDIQRSRQRLADLCRNA